jgi:hypothetical protein
MAENGHNSDMANPGNWIALSRGVREHPIVGAGQPVKPADLARGSWSRMEAWFDLLCLAQFKPSRVNNKGEVQTLDVGQLMGAIPFLASRWNWTDKTVRVFLATLEREGMISSNQGRRAADASSNKCRVITINNYSKYQLLSDAIREYLGGLKGQARGRQTAGQGQAKGSNLTLEHLNKTPPKPPEGGDAIENAFEEFWTTFPGNAPPRGRKTDKPKAFEAFRRVATNTHRKRLHATVDEMIRGAKRYAATKPDPDFIPMPTTWLNGARWLDETAPASSLSSLPWWKDPQALADMTSERWRAGIGQFANGTWPVDKLGPPPGHHQCVVPPDLIDELRLTDRYDTRGINRDRH